MGTVRYTVADGEILAENRNGTKRDYLPDPLGSTVALLDSSQAQTDTYTYWPYGEQASSTGSTDTPFRYVGTLGYHRDKASINVKTYVRARYLDHAKCRWMTPDPIGYAGGDWNLYRYAFNNPVNNFDLSGLQPFPGGFCCSNLIQPAQDICISCKGLNPLSDTVGYRSCADCCTALNNSTGGLVNLVSGYIGPIPNILPSANSFQCFTQCTSECTKMPSGSLAIVNYLECALKNLKQSIASEIAAAILRGLNNIVKTFA